MPPRAGGLRLCIARLASIQKIVFIKAFKIAEGLNLILHSCKSRISPQGEKMCFTGVAKCRFQALFHMVPVHGGFPALWDSDVAQTLMSGEKMFRESDCSKQEAKPNISHCGGTPRKLMSCVALLLSICLISQLPNHRISLSRLPASESLH